MKKCNNHIYIKYFLFFLSVFLILNKTVLAFDCSKWADLKNEIQNLFDFIKIIIPLLIIGLSSYDFIKAIGSKDEKNQKKAFQILLKRLVLAVIFFFLPLLLNLLFEIFEINANVCVS